MALVNYATLRGSILAYDDEPSDLERFAEELTKVLPQVSLELARRPDSSKSPWRKAGSVNLQIEEQEPEPDEEFEEDVAHESEGEGATSPAVTLRDAWLSLDRLVRTSLTGVDVVVVDLKLGDFEKPSTFQSIYELTGDFTGLAVLDSITGGYLFREEQEIRTGYPRVLINSAQIASLKGNRRFQIVIERLTRLIDAGAVGVFRKDPGNLEPLLCRVASILDLKARGYHCDLQVQNQLLVISQRQRSTRQESVLILGKSGTGKEEAAWHIHQVGQLMRRNLDQYSDGLPLEVVHCGSLSSALARDELFGHVKGAFTDASGHKLGKVITALGAKTRDRLAPFEPAKRADAAQKEILKIIRECEARFSANSGTVQNAQRGGATLESVVQQFSHVATACSDLLRIDVKPVENYLKTIASMEIGSAASNYKEWLRRTGLFEDIEGHPLSLRVRSEAPYGTLFLDEFASLDPTAQALLLRFTQELEIQPLGYEGKIILIDKDGKSHLRLIGATNERKVYFALGLDPDTGDRLESQPDNDDPRMQARYFFGERFRPDLGYRMGQWIVHVPDLKASEVDAMIQLETKAFKSDADIERAPSFDSDSRKALMRWVEDGQFPGQRRELRTIIRRAMIMATVPQELGLQFDTTKPEVTVKILEAVFRPVAMKPHTTDALEGLIRERLCNIGGKEISQNRKWRNIRQAAEKNNRLYELADFVIELLLCDEKLSPTQVAKLLGGSINNLNSFPQLKEKLKKHLEGLGLKWEEDMSTLTPAKFLEQCRAKKV